MARSVNEEIPRRRNLERSAQAITTIVETP
jgi:hypothetical protein